MKRSFEKTLNLIFILLLLGLLFLGNETRKNNELGESTDAWVEHTHDVLFESQQVLSLSQDLALGSRGYVITGDSLFLQPFHKAIDSLPVHLTALKNLIQDNQIQVQQVDLLEKLVDLRIQYSLKINELITNGDYNKARQVIASQKGKYYLDEIRKVTHQINTEENRLLIQRQTTFTKTNTKAKRFFYSLLLGTFFILIGIFFIIKSNLRSRNKAQETLFIKNEWFSQLLISLGDGVITTDAHGIITLINKAASELLGWTKEEAVGKPIEQVFDITNETTGLKVLNPLLEAMRKNKIMWLSNHTILKRKDGSKLFIDDSGAPIHNQKKEIIGGVLIFRDITENKKAEKQLEESEEKFRSLMNNTPVGITLTTVDGKILEANQTLLDMMGFESKEEFINTPLTDIYFDKNERARMIELFKKNGRLRNFEIQVKQQSGELIWISAHVIPFKMPGGETVLLSSSLDITQRKKAEEKLKEYQHFFNNSNDLSCIANTEGYFEIINPNFEKELGYSEKELLENQFLNFIHPDDIATTLAEVEKLKTGAKTINFANRYRKKDGAYLWFDWNTTPDPITGKLYAIARDITERKKAEFELETLTGSLIEAQEIANSGSWELNFITGINTWSKNHYALFELDELTVNPSFDLFLSMVHPDDLHIVLEVQKNIEIEKKSKEIEIRIKMKNGSLRWMSDKIIPILDKDKLIGLKGVIVDITERKITQELLKQKSKELAESNHEIIDSINYARRIQKSYN